MGGSVRASGRASLALQAETAAVKLQAVQRGNLARAAAAEAAAGADPPPFEPVGGGDEDDDAEDDAACADGEVGASPAGAAAADGSASDRCVDDSPAAAALELRIASAEEELEAAYAARDTRGL